MELMRPRTCPGTSSGYWRGEMEGSMSFVDDDVVNCWAAYRVTRRAPVACVERARKQRWRGEGRGPGRGMGPGISEGTGLCLLTLTVESRN